MFMKRNKILSVPASLNVTSLEEYSDLFEDSQPKLRREELRRWRRLKHQLA